MGTIQTLEKARKMFVKKVVKDKFLNDYDFMIRGLYTHIERRPNYTHKTNGIILNQNKETL